MHKIFVDADACPVKAEIMEVAKNWNVEAYFVASYAHSSNNLEGRWIYIEPSQDGVDFYIFEHVETNDIVVTQDMGLASLLLQKGVEVISSRGDIIKESEIDAILYARHVSAKKRKAGQRTKGPKPLLKKDKINFYENLQKILSNKKELNEF